MKYDYVCDETGEAKVIECSMKDAPDWTFVEDGKKWRRAMSAGSVRVRGVDRDARGNRIGNRSLPRNWPFAKKHDSAGRPVFESKAERDEAHAKAAAAGELLTPRELSQPGQQSGMRLDD